MLEISEVLKLQTPEGQKEFLALIQACKTNAGENWLKEMNAYFPNLYKIADLVANHTFEDAYKIICKEYPAAMMFKSQLQTIHEKLKFEINKPRKL